MKRLTFLLTLLMLIGLFSTAEALSPVSIRSDHDAVDVTIASDEESVATLTAGVIIGTIPGVKNTEFTIRAAKVGWAWAHQSAFRDSDSVRNQGQASASEDSVRNQRRFSAAVDSDDALSGARVHGSLRVVPGGARSRCDGQWQGQVNRLDRPGA